MTELETPELIHDMPAEFLRRPYGDRQLISIVADEAALAEREARDGTVDAGWVEPAADLLRGMLAKRGQVVPALAITVALELYRAFQRMRDQGYAVVTVSRSEAAALRLPPGHPRDKVIYVGHPARPANYLPVAQFHRFVFEDKVAEAMRLLMALGATKLNIEHVSGWNATTGLDIDVPIVGKMRGAAKGDSKAENERRVMVEATLKAQGEPALPNDLIWFHFEPLWQALADARLNHGLESFNLDVRYEDDYGVHAGLKSTIAKVGLDVGGEFENHQVTVWRLSGEFG